MLSYALDLAVAVAAGAVAAVTGFGIGSLLTPLFAWRIDTNLAVAAVSIPHVVGTAIRFALLRGGINRRVFWQFGLTSAVGGLAGALLQQQVANRPLTVIFGLLLLFAAASETTGLSRRLRFHGAVAWIAGALSGVLGGLVGNQGGIRSAALLGFDLSKRELVATATAVALMVDGARLPVYLSTKHRELMDLWPWIGLTMAGVVIGTVIGSRLLARLSDVWFRRALSIVLAVLGASMIFRAWAL